VHGLLWWLLVGLIAGFLAGKVMKGQGYGILMDILVGIVGSILGGFLFGLIGIVAVGFIGSIVVAFAGAVILIWLVRRFKRT
jgi:uncharacterized membrane protein YeaQ/YmgE (transglycosylase-associated protein family)